MLYIVYTDPLNGLGSVPVEMVQSAALDPSPLSSSY